MQICKKKKKKVFLYEKYERDYSQLYSQFYLSESLFRTLLSILHFFTKSKIVLSIVFKNVSARLLHIYVTCLPI